MIDLKELKKLIALMTEHNLSELDVSDQEQTVVIKRPLGGAAALAPMTAAAAVHAPPVSSPGPEPVDADAGLVAIESPMVGTFYTTQNPDSPPFVKVGDNVSDESVVCLIEAMKVFNEVKAECNGSIAKVLVKNGDAVEFGQKLFLINPA